MQWTLYDEIASYDSVDARADSFQLEQFRTLDFGSAMSGELAKVVSKNANIHERYVALVHKFCNDRAKQYVLRPTRKFSAGGATAERKLEEVYTNSAMDWALLGAHQKAEGQSGVVLLVEPDRPLQVRVRSFIQAETDVDLGQDLMNRDLRTAAKLTLRWPMRRDGDTILYGRRVYTPTEAWQEGPGSTKKAGLFNRLDPGDLRNPLGFIPAVGVQLIEPPHGWWWPRLPLDILSVQIGLIVGLSDIENIVRIKAPGREVVAGEDAKAAVKTRHQAGPEGLLALEGEGLTYTYASLDPRIDRYLAAIETTLKLCAVYRDVNPDGLWTSSGITGDAKEVEREEILEARKRAELVWASAEQDLAEVVARVASVGPRAIELPSARVHVDYHYVQARRNDLQTQQARALACFLGLDSALEIIERTENTPSREYAVSLYEERLQAARELMAGWRDESGAIKSPPGLDSIAQQVIPGR